MSPYLAKALLVLDPDKTITITHLREKFDANISDVDWLNQLGREKDWVIVSGDNRILTRKAELRAWRDSKNTAFFMHKNFTRQGIWEMTSDFTKRWPEMKMKASTSLNGNGFKTIRLKHDAFEPVFNQ